MARAAFAILWCACWSITAIAGLSLEKQMQQLVENYEVLAAKLEAVEQQNMRSLEAQAIHVQNLERKIQQQASLLTALRGGNQITRADAETRQTPATGMPRSCSDLKARGHTLSGLYLIMGAKTVETVYCDLRKSESDPTLQTWIGFADVKSMPVYFNALRSSTTFKQVQVPIPFDVARVNVGGAMNLSTGKFTAPRVGKYFFIFTGTASFLPSAGRSSLNMGLCLNGNSFGDIVTYGLSDESNSNVYQQESLTLQSTLHLNAGDQVWLQIGFLSGSFLEGGGGFGGTNHFSGWLLEEDISQSLTG
ncbi:hypothetical protein OUZ56_020272 [Daphnia magna]|uniref:C1q domain-containing protein n=2 Tax=Daphnia magna TaxID=35525 RepID=A0ABQ9ZE11_9CRUS|nr:hypothetical protein OUZ56_020272 [Daphnia magna]